MSPLLPENKGADVDRSVYKLLFLCEDWAAREKARGLRNRLADNCQNQVILEAKFYSFAALCHPEVRETAKQDVNESDMFIVISSGTANLPLSVQNWLNEFSPMRKPMACVEFFEPSISVPFPRHFMEHWSLQAGMAFFSNRMPPAIEGAQNKK